MNEIIRMVEEKIVPKHKPAVYISGGLDSTVLLHHLVEKVSGDVYTYTAKFGLEGDEDDDAQRVADHYKTVHKVVKFSNFVENLPQILVNFDRPRYNVWVYFLVKEARNDGRKTGYGADGADEHFGGYSNKTYLQAWADHIVYIRPIYEVTHRIFGLDLEFPYGDLDWEKTKKFHENPNKRLFREAYRGVIPDFVINKKKTPPPFADYWKLWNKELKQYFPDYVPKSVEDIKTILQSLATEAWLKSNLVWSVYV